MKKNFRTLAFAFAVMGLAIACNNNATEETTDSVIDSTPVVVEEVIDSTPVVEEAVTPTTPKKTAKKTEATKEEVKTPDASKVTIGDASTTVTVKKDGIKVVKGDSKKAPDASKVTIEGNNGSVSGSGNTATMKIKK